MPVYQKLVNFNTMFSLLSEPPIIINDLANTSEVERGQIQQLLTSRYAGDVITLLPSCRCGITKGEFSVGVKCSYCFTVVKSTVENDIEPSVWFRKPNGVDKLINPVIWIMLKNRFTRSGFNIMQWITDTTFKSHVKTPPIMTKIFETGIQRGYNNFVKNFDSIINILFSMREFRLKGESTDYLKVLIEQNRDTIFSDYIPLPNKTLMIVEKTNTGTYVDPMIADAVDAIEMLISIDRDFYDQNPKTKENRTAKATAKLAEFYEKFYKGDLSTKGGQFRRHVFGSRTNFSFRAVISSLTDTHKYDEIHVPWGIGLTVFRPHILNKLMKIGMDINSAIGLLLGHIEKYHPLLDQVLTELLTDTKTGSIYCLIQRNPSLLQGSAQRVRITKFKKDPIDHTISLSILICKAFNADFDGK